MNISDVGKFRNHHDHEQNFNGKEGNAIRVIDMSR